MCEKINMDFWVGLPRNKKHHGSIWVVVDTLTKSAHFIPIKSTKSADDYARIFIDEIVCLHGIRLSILSDMHNKYLYYGGNSKKA